MAQGRFAGIQPKFAALLKREYQPTKEDVKKKEKTENEATTSGTVSNKLTNKEAADVGAKAENEATTSENVGEKPTNKEEDVEAKEGNKQQDEAIEEDKPATEQQKPAAEPPTVEITGPAEDGGKDIGQHLLH
jgi:hypothetical protein